jgi:hypothetical protein
MVVAALVISVIALLLALPTVFQLIWARPNIEIMFMESIDKRAHRKYLHCQIVNPPLENRFLRKFGVYRRPIDDVHFLFSVRDTKTSKMMVTNIIASIYTTQIDKPMPSVSLPASAIPAMINLVEARDDGYTNTVAPYEAKNIQLPVGEYCAIIRIRTSERDREYHRNFCVGNKQQDLRWNST